MNRQAGASGIMMLIMVVLAVSGLIMVLKLLPLYSQSWAVETILENLHETSKGAEYTPADIEEMLQKRLEVNDIEHLMEHVVVEGTPSQIIIDMEYERRVGLFSNIELVATFKHYVDFSE